MQHTHFGSATHIAATFLGVLFAGTLWRIAAYHAIKSNRPLLRGWGRMALFQY